jgi:hypothetical protein
MGATFMGPDMPGFPRDYYKVDWSQAACQGSDTESFYVENAGQARSLNPTLRRICGDCPIVSECATHAIKHERYGFWGGLTAVERLHIREGVDK